MNIFINSIKELPKESSSYQPLETPTYSLAEYSKIEYANAYLFYLEDIVNKEPGINRDMIMQHLLIQGRFSLLCVV